MSAIQLHEEKAGAAPASVLPIRRRSRWGWWIAAVLGAAVIAVLVLRPGGGGEEITYITEAATVGDLEEVVEGTGVVGFDDGDLVAVAPRVSGTVTEVHIEDGSGIDPMTAIVDIDGRTLWAVAGESPVYRDLSVDAEGSDVETLELSLLAAGYEPGEIDEVFDADTQAAMEEWQEDNDLEVTGRFEVASFIWAPADSRALDVVVTPGLFVDAGASLVTAGSTDGNVVRVSIDQADVTSVEPGDEVRIEIDGIDQSLRGTVASVSLLPIEATEYEVVVTLEESDDLLLGMEGTVAIVVDTLEDVVLIPTGALGGSSSAATVDVLVDGVAETRPVTTGLTTPTQVEITSGLSEGEQVVIGEVAE